MPCIVVTRDGDTLTIGADSARTAQPLASFMEQPQAAHRRHSQDPAAPDAERDAFPRITVGTLESRP